MNKRDNQSASTRNTRNNAVYGRVVTALSLFYCMLSSCKLAVAAVRTGDSLIRKAVGYGGRSGRRCRTRRRRRTSRKFPRPNYTVIHGSTSRPFSVHLKKKHSNSSACFFLAGRDFYYSFVSYFSFFSGLIIVHLSSALRAAPRGLYILPLILYAYRHHGLHDRGRDLLEPFEEI